MLPSTQPPAHLSCPTPSQRKDPNFLAVIPEMGYTGLSDWDDEAYSYEDDEILGPDEEWRASSALPPRDNIFCRPAASSRTHGGAPSIYDPPAPPSDMGAFPPPPRPPPLKGNLLGLLDMTTADTAAALAWDDTITTTTLPRGHTAEGHTVCLVDCHEGNGPVDERMEFPDVLPGTNIKVVRMKSGELRPGIKDAPSRLKLDTADFLFYNCLRCVGGVEAKGSDSGSTREDVVTLRDELARMSECALPTVLMLWLKRSAVRVPVFIKGKKKFVANESASLGAQLDAALHFAAVPDRCAVFSYNDRKQVFNTLAHIAAFFLCDPERAQRRPVAISNGRKGRATAEQAAVQVVRGFPGVGVQRITDMTLSGILDSSKGLMHIISVAGTYRNPETGLIDIPRMRAATKVSEGILRMAVSIVFGTEGLEGFFSPWGRPHIHYESSARDSMIVKAGRKKTVLPRQHEKAVGGRVAWQ